MDTTLTMIDVYGFNKIVLTETVYMAEKPVKQR